MLTPVFRMSSLLQHPQTRYGSNAGRGELHFPGIVDLQCNAVQGCPSPPTATRRSVLTDLIRKARSLGRSTVGPRGPLGE